MDHFKLKFKPSLCFPQFVIFAHEYSCFSASAIYPITFKISDIYLLYVLCKWSFRTNLFYSARFLASRHTSKLEDYSWSADHDYLFNIFAVNPHIRRSTPPYAPRQDVSCSGDGTLRRILCPNGMRKGNGESSTMRNLIRSLYRSPYIVRIKSRR